MRVSCRTHAVLLLACVLGFALPARAVNSFSFTRIDVPGGTETSVHGTNGAGQMVGTFSGGVCGYRGYLRAATGTFTHIDVEPYPSKCETPRQTTTTDAYGINDAGQIVGSYSNGWEQRRHGYVRSGTGALTSIDVPGAAQTEANGVNRAGWIVGSFEDAGRKWHGYLRTSTGTFTPIDVPGATWTEANGINSAGQIVGTFTDAAIGYPNPWPPPWHGFVTRR